MLFVLESHLIELVSGLVHTAGDGFGIDFMKGTEAPTPPRDPNQFRVDIESNLAPLPDYFEVGGTPVVTTRCLEALQTVAGSSVQSFPVPIQFRNSTVQGHHVINVTRRVKCVDEVKSELSRLYSHIFRIHNLRLRKDLGDGHDMFRADEYPEVIFISQRVKTALERYKISGCRLQSAEGWSDAHRF